MINYYRNKEIYCGEEAFVRSHDHNIMPEYVIGPNETVPDVRDIFKGTNGLVIGALLGYKVPVPHSRKIDASDDGKLQILSLDSEAESSHRDFTVHVDDVAKLHVLSLDSKFKENQAFLATGPNFGSISWADSIDIVKKHYRRECGAGALGFDSIIPPVTIHGKVDSSKATKAFTIQFEGFDKQVESLVDHVLDLSGWQ